MLTSLFSAFYVSCQSGTARIRCRAPCCGAAAVERRLLMYGAPPCSNRSVSPARRALSRKPAAAAANDAKDGHRRTIDRYTDPVPHTMLAVPKTTL